jgi:SPX domain protein involved in polyphosphate accumulation
MDTADRFEYKFLIDREARATLLGRLEGSLLPDTQGGSDGHYPIISLYYDSPDLRCYWDNWRGVPSRRKLRVRAYGSADGAIPPTSFIEVKHKADGRGVKRRVQTDLANALALVAGGGDDSRLGLPDLRILAEVRQLVEADGFRPTCVMRYDRHAYFLRLPGQADAAALRVTFDESIRVRFDELTPATDDRRFARDILPADRCIMEVKGSGAVPYLFADHLTRLRLSPRNFSKYGEAVRLGGRHLAAAA